MPEQKEYIGKAGFEVLSKERFGLARKIVSNMTLESWETIPHSSGIYEPDATNFLAQFQSARNLPGWEGVGLNTVLLYAFTQALIACPAMNAHLTFKRGTISGIIEQFADVNITMPTMLPDGSMVTMNVHNCERKTLRQLQDYINDLRRRAANTSMDDAMYSVAIHDSLQKLKKLKIKKVLGRLIGTKIGAGPINRLKGEAKKKYKAVPAADKLSRLDLEQGTIVISNVGSVYRSPFSLSAALLEVIPPHVAAIGIGPICDKPGVVTREDGTKEIEPRRFMPIGIAMDHRALDFGDLIPFLQRMDDIFLNPAQMLDWI